VRGPGGDEPQVEDNEAWKTELREMGFSKPDIDSAFAQRDALAPVQPDPERLLVWPENEPALEIFLAMETQWHFHPTSGQQTGLRYDALEHTLVNLAVMDPRAVRADVRVMERAALDELRILAKLKTRDTPPE
jgi:hypothetical protein